MPKLSFARFNDSAERARSGWAEYASELQHLSPLITELDVVLPQARAASMLQGLKQVEFQQATRDVEALVARGNDLVVRIRAGVRSAFGNRSEKLTAFDMKPLRPGTRRPRAEKKSQQVAPSAVETPTE
ncbi:MAG TPA: hypothetical protein VF756_15770 [Thermoanaerobaculia bacterium]